LSGKERTCRRCGGGLDRADRQTCSACRATEMERWRTVYNTRKEAGLCPDCGGLRDCDDKITCSACIERHSTYNKIRRGTLQQARTVVVVPLPPVHVSPIPGTVAVLLKRRIPGEESIRSLVLDVYGSKCVCCGLEDRGVLSLDHIDGGGNKHRAALRVGSGQKFYRWVIAHDFPSFLQLLCANCHARKTRYGRCPCSPEREAVVLTERAIVRRFLSVG
jgi:hypothetical protein